MQEQKGKSVLWDIEHSKQIPSGLEHPLHFDGHSNNYFPNNRNLLMQSN